MRRSSLSAGTISDQSAPIVLADLGQRIGDRDRGHQAAIDRNLGQFRALVAHRQDRAAEASSTARMRGGSGRRRIGAADDDSARAWSRADRATEHQRLDLIIQPLGGQARRACA